MMSQKLEQLLCIRNQLDQIEIISWNDVSDWNSAIRVHPPDLCCLRIQYGEAHYIGDIGGDQPAESRLYTTGSKSTVEHSETLR